MSAKDKRQKRTRIDAQPSSSKRVAQCLDCDILKRDEARPSWRFDLLSREPIFGLSTIDPDDWAEILGKLANLEGTPMGEIFNGSCGKTYTNPSGITNKQARERFSAEYEDRDAVHCLRFSGTGRLYGFRHGAVFEVLWWDPDHQIWESKLKHT